jgi:hypothetical protein
MGILIHIPIARCLLYDGGDIALSEDEESGLRIAHWLVLCSILQHCRHCYVSGAAGTRRTPQRHASFPVTGFKVSGKKHAVFAESRKSGP